MSHRDIVRDPVESRRDAYRELEASGESQEALWEAIEAISLLSDVGVKGTAMLVKRKEIKAALPKA